jgi:hypothetical protein
MKSMKRMDQEYESLFEIVTSEAQICQIPGIDTLWPPQL